MKLVLVLSLFCLVLLFYIQTVQSSDCSVSKSSQAKKSLKNNLDPVLDYYSYQLPEKCPFHPSKNLLQSFQNQKKELRRTKWKCNVCNKTFKNENFLDEHLQNVHYEELYPTGSNRTNLICWGDYCDILTCGSETQVPLVPCDQTEKDKRRFLCNAIVDQCFPSDKSTTSHHLNELYQRIWCSKLTCEEQEEDSLLKSFKSRWSSWSVFWTVIGSLLTVFMIAFYVILFIYRRELQSHDLRRRSMSWSEYFHSFLPSNVGKLKGY